MINARLSFILSVFVFALGSVDSAYSMVCSIAFVDAAKTERSIEVEFSDGRSAEPLLFPRGREVSTHRERVEYLRSEILGKIAQLREVSENRDHIETRERSGDPKSRIETLAVLSRILPQKINTDPDLSVSEKIEIALKLETHAIENELVSPIRAAHLSRYQMYRDGVLQFPAKRNGDTESEFSYEILQLDSLEVQDALRAYRATLMMGPKSEARRLTLKRLREYHSADALQMYLELKIETDYERILNFVESLDLSISE